MLILSATKHAGAQYIIKEADAAYELFNYAKAISLYEQAYQKKQTLYTARQLASGYQLTQNYKETERWCAIVLKKSVGLEQDRLNYAIALQQNGKYNEAKLQYEKLNNLVTSKQKAIWLASCDSAQHWMASPGLVVVSAEQSLNSEGSDWGAAIYQGGVVFASDRYNVRQLEMKNREPFFKFDGNQYPNRKVYGWTGKKYLDLYEQMRGSQVVTHFSLPVNTDYHLASVSFSEDEKTVYFALTRIPEKKKHYKDGVLTVNVELFSSQKDDYNKWKKPLPFKYNKVFEYSVGDPFLSRDGKILYFVSNMPGGKGGSDIYYCENKGGNWGNPVNMVSVNTEGNERSPAFDEAGNFYFSSDGRVGMGGLDIFTAQRSDREHEFLDIRNMGFPFNSPQDDFSCMFSTSHDGFFASNRYGGLGSDDIYSFHQVKGLPVISAHALSSLKRDTVVENRKLAKNSLPIAERKIKLSTNSLSGRIYYALGKADISPKTVQELNILIIFLRENPAACVELRSYTDCRGSYDLNLILAQLRSNSIVKFLVDRGINKLRINAKAYGEAGLLNKCDNGVLCSEVEHQINRRTEFDIIL